MNSPDPAAARVWAVGRHGDQRYGELAYEVHLAAAVGVLRRHGVSDPAVLCAAWLHDVVEDTSTTRDEVADAFGDRVADMVAAVTDGNGSTRAERKATSYARIAATPGASLVKLADRIANVQACWQVRSPKLFMYHSEYPAFRSELRPSAPSDVEDALWAELDGLLGWRA